jgi:hypothetical protein
VRMRIVNLIGVVILAVALIFSVYQLNISTVRASGCPSYPAASQLANCGGCTLVEQTAIYEEGQPPHWNCFYSCWGCPGPGGEPMMIEHTEQAYD